MARAEAMHQLIGFNASLFAGIGQKVQACASGGSIVGPLRS